MMERFAIITNKKGLYPIYFLIDRVTGYKLLESENKAGLEEKKKDLDLFHEYYV
jgi:hypothetical protein